MSMHRSDIPRLSDDAANKLLNNVFDSCLQDPNTIPLSALQSYTEYRRERYSLQKILLIAVLAVFLLLPLFFLSPDITVTESGFSAEGFPTYSIYVDSVIPISGVAASIGDEGLIVSETAERTYSVVPHKNGILKVYARAVNRQYCVTEVTVENVDIEPPVITSNRSEDGLLYLYVEDQGVGINYSGIYASGDNGNDIKPLSASDGTVVYSLPEGSLDIYIPDNNNNVLHLVITVAATR